MASANVLLLAADNPAKVIPLLQQDSSLASTQDEHGYSLVHAAASYNHLDLLRALVNDFHVNVNLKDEDGETALFVTETMECAKILVEEFHADITIRSIEGQTAREKISEENDFPQVAIYLRMKELETQVTKGSTAGAEGRDENKPETANAVHPPPPLPEGVSVDFGTMAPEDAGEVVDPDFKRKIDELASREDFQGPGGQEALRALVEKVLREQFQSAREVRQRTN